MKNYSAKNLYALLITTILLITTTKAQIVYTDIPNQTFSCSGNNCTSSYNLDLNNDGANDFVIGSGHSHINAGPGVPSITISSVSIAPSGNNAIMSTLLNTAKKLFLNDTIDSAKTWQSTSGQSLKRYQQFNTTITWVGEWNNEIGKYLGLEFNVAGQIFYGWARLDVNVIANSSTFTIKDYAYNAIPGQPILAGQMSPSAPTINGVSLICSGDSATISVNGGNTYSWNTGATTSSITVSPTGITTYSVTVTDTVLGYSIVLTKQIIVVTINTTVTQQNCSSLVLAPNAPSTMQWFDCSNWQPIAGATTNNFSPIASGIYSAVISKVGCVDTTACYYAAPINFSVTGNTTLCLGESTTLSVTNGNSFLWSTGETTSAITVSPLSTTTYTVDVTDSNGACSFSQQIIVNSVNTLVTQPDCNTLISQESLPTSIQWFDCNVLQQIPGATSSTFVPSTPGSYSAIISKNGCTDTTACYHAAAINFSGTGNTAICLGESITLSITNGNTFLWNTGNTTSTITVSPLITSLYIINVTDTVGACTMNFIQQITVTSINTSLTQSGDTLFANTGFPATYQWMECTNMQIVPGATSAIFLASSSGSYAVIISDNGCTDTSACAAVIGLGINEQQNIFGISISPNPFSISATISFVNKQSQIISAKICDATGKIVSTLCENKSFQEGEYQFEWNVENVDAGIYFLKIEGGDFSETKKLSVVK